MRIPFLRPRPDEAAPAKPRRSRGPKAAPVVDVLDVEAARTQARRRLVGALVLLAIGVVGFPVLFETQPRPLAPDTPMEAVRREPAVSGAVVRESANSRPTPVITETMSAAEAAANAQVQAPAQAPAASAAVAAAATPTSTPASPPMSKPAPMPQATVAPVLASAPSSVASLPAAAKPAVVAAAAPPPAAPAKVVPPPTAPTPPKAASESAPVDGAAIRFVIQAGAYKESAKLREARSKIEGLGYKTYTQVVEIDNSTRTRVRVGPFTSQQEAEAVAAKIKRNGLPAAIIKL